MDEPRPFGLFLMGAALCLRGVGELPSCLVLMPIALLLAWPDWEFRAFILPGAVLNMTAVISNGGRMPVAGKSGWTATHIPMGTETVAWWLCDWLPGGSSPGDWLLLIGICAVSWRLWRTRPRMVRS